MFEVGMSALVLKICSEYAKSLGLNFPPCTQQEINAICEWVDKHTIKDMTISQDGYNVTFTFKTENDTTKEFPFTIPTAIDLNEPEKVLKGSDTVVVNRSEDNSKLQVRLDQSVINDINGKLTAPTTPAAESAVTMLADGTVGTKPLSEIGGGGKLYLHTVRLDFGAAQFNVSVNIINTSSTLITDIEYIKSCLIEGTIGYFNGSKGRGAVAIYYYLPSDNYGVEGVIVGDNIVNDNYESFFIRCFFPLNQFEDISATEL